VADFGVASAELRKKVENIRPRKTSPLSDRVAFAVWLDQLGLKDEARKYWKAVAVERPDDPQLSGMAAD